MFSRTELPFPGTSEYPITRCRRLAIGRTRRRNSNTFRSIGVRSQKSYLGRFAGRRLKGLFSRVFFGKEIIPFRNATLDTRGLRAINVEWFSVWIRRRRRL